MNDRKRYKTNEQKISKERLPKRRMKVFLIEMSIYKNHFNYLISVRNFE